MVLADLGGAHVEDDEAALLVEGDLDLVGRGAGLLDRGVEVQDPQARGLLLDLSLVADVLVLLALVVVPRVDVPGGTRLDLAEDGRSVLLGTAGGGNGGDGQDDGGGHDGGTDLARKHNACLQTYSKESATRR